MFKWLTKISGKIGLCNVKTNTKHLILFCNKAEEKIEVQGKTEQEIVNIVLSQTIKTQKLLLYDMRLAIANDKSIQQVLNAVAKGMDPKKLSLSAQVAIAHVIKHFKNDQSKGKNE